MAVRTRVIRIDDYTQLELTETGQQIVFVVDGVRYELDLSKQSVKRFHDALAPFLRNVQGRRLPRDLWREVVLVTTGAQVSEKGTVREFWYANHERLNLPAPKATGRFPKKVTDAYYGRQDAATGQGGDEGASGQTG